MSPKKPKKYRARSKAVPDWYIVERSQHYGLIGTFDNALIETEAWWEENLAPGWETFFDLEEVEEQQEAEVPT